MTTETTQTFQTKREIQIEKLNGLKDGEKSVAGAVKLLTNLRKTMYGYGTEDHTRYDDKIDELNEELHIAKKDLMDFQSFIEADCEADIKTIKSEIVNAIQDIHYMDTENISNIIVQYYDDNEYEFIKTKHNSLITLIFEGDLETDDPQCFNYNICKDKIFLELLDYYEDHTKPAYIEGVAELKRLGHYKNINGRDYKLDDETLEGLLDHIKLVYESNYVDLEESQNNNFRLYLEFQHKDFPPICREFDYIKTTDDNLIIDETDVFRDARFTKFIEMCKTNIPKWIEKL